MRNLVVLLVLGAVCNAVVHKMSLTYQEPVSHRMHKQGKLAAYEEMRHARRTSNLQSVSTQVPDFDDMAYFSLITLGTPGQTFVMFLDSGSSTMWVPDVSCAEGQQSTCGSYCKTVPVSSCLTFCDNSCCTTSPKFSKLANNNACTAKHRFDQTKSSSYVKQTGTFDLTYQTGEVTGFLGMDTFCFANTSLCVSSQIFGQAQTIGADFAKQPQDGILGLGWPALAFNNINPPMFNAMNQQLLDRNVYAIYMAGIGPSTSMSGGQLTVGATDTTNCNGNVAYAPLTSKTFWQFKMSGVSAGTFSQTPASGWQAMVDTGSTFIGGPQTVVSALAKQVGATFVSEFNSYFIDCDAASPDIVFMINGANYRVRAKNYILSVGPGPCIFAFFPLASGGFSPAWMLGPPLIREYCVTHDMGGAQIGFSQVLQQ